MLNKNTLQCITVGAAKVLITVLMCLYCTHTKAQSFDFNKQAPIDSCSYYKRKLDTTMHQLYMCRQQINAAKFYVKICEKKPTNKKFLYGWLKNRALVDKPSYDPKPIQ